MQCRDLKILYGLSWRVGLITKWLRNLATLCKIIVPVPVIVTGRVSYITKWSAPPTGSLSIYNYNLISACHDMTVMTRGARENCPCTSPVPCTRTWRDKPKFSWAAGLSPIWADHPGQFGSRRSWWRRGWAGVVFARAAPVRTATAGTWQCP